MEIKILTNVARFCYDDVAVMKKKVCTNESVEEGWGEGKVLVSVRNIKYIQSFKWPMSV